MSSIPPINTDDDGASSSRHTYNILLNERDPLATQPEKIQVPLKPHQLVALQRAIYMEREGSIDFNALTPAAHLISHLKRSRGYQQQVESTITFQGHFTMESNLGIIGDVVGYGKSLIALAIIAATPSRMIHRRMNDVFNYGRCSSAHVTVTCHRKRDIYETSHFLNTTLLIVPHGNVFEQWQKAIREQTSLRALVVDTLPRMRKNLPPSTSSLTELKQYFEGYDLVLIKATFFDTFFHFYCQRRDPELKGKEQMLTSWNRIMVDEATKVLKDYSIPTMRYRFLWLISATFIEFLEQKYINRAIMLHSLHEFLIEERLNLLAVRSEEAFVKRSFNVPPSIAHSYLCHMPNAYSAVLPFLPPAVQERFNANDIPGVIQKLGGTNETESDIVALVTKEIERDIHNKKREIEFMEGLQISDDVRQVRLTTMKNELARLEQKLSDLRDRVTMLTSRDCSICQDTITSPILLPCAHAFCGKCLLRWMRMCHTCPECRLPIQSRQLIAVIETKGEEEQVRSGEMSAEDDSRILSKEDQLLKIIRNKPDGRFLIFSKQDNSFQAIEAALTEHNISFSTLCGTTGSMVKTLNKFINGQLSVILLNTRHAGCGIDISCATDVILFHTLGIDGIQAVGRAQRVGRTSPLHIHQLYYPNEAINLSIPPSAATTDTASTSIGL